MLDSSNQPIIRKNKLHEQEIAYQHLIPNTPPLSLATRKSAVAANTYQSPAKTIICVIDRKPLTVSSPSFRTGLPNGLAPSSSLTLPATSACFAARSSVVAR